MFIYLVILLNISLYLLLNKRVNLLTLCFIVVSNFIFLFSLRGENYGMDIKTYYNIFLDSSYYQLDEPGLTYINSLMKIISTNHVWFSFCYALILNLFILLLYRVIDDALYVYCFMLLTCTFVYFQINLNIYRQGLSAIIALLGLYMAYKSNKLYLILAIISVFIHKASLFLIIIFPFVNLKINPLFILLSIALSFIPLDFVLSFPIFNTFTEYVSNFTTSLDEYQRLESIDMILSSSYDHRNIPVIISLLIICYFKQFREGDKLVVSNVMLMSYLGASIFKSNVLLYDRIILFAQLLTPCIFMSFLRIYVKRSFNLIVFLMFLTVSFFTCFIWGPRNFLGPYEFISGL